MNKQFSAAQCVNEELLVLRSLTLHKVRLGEHNRKIVIDCDGKNCTHTIDIPIQKIISHPNYTLSNSVHDIALLRLKHSISFSDSIKPICLPPVQFQNKIYDNVPLNVIGWRETKNGKYREKLFVI